MIVEEACWKACTMQEGSKVGNNRLTHATHDITGKDKNGVKNHNTKTKWHATNRTKTERQQKTGEPWLWPSNPINLEKEEGSSSIESDLPSGYFCRPASRRPLVGGRSYGGPLPCLRAHFFPV